MRQAVLKQIQSVMHGTTMALDILADIRAHVGRGAVIEIIEQTNAVPMEDRCQAFLRLVVLDAPMGGDIGPGITTAVSLVGGILERHGPEYTLALLSRIGSLPVELTRFCGHVILSTGGVRDAEVKTAIPAGIPAQDRRPGARRAKPQ
jgi:hypothetical protein